MISVSIFSSALYKISFEDMTGFSNQKFVVKDNSLFLTGTKENNIVFNSVSDEISQKSYSFDNSISSVAICDFGFCGISNPQIQDNLYFYDIYFQSFDNSYTNHINLSFEYKINHINFAIDNDFNFYVFAPKQSDSILKFSKKGKLLKKFYTENQTEQLMLIDNTVYCICNGTMFKIDKNDLVEIHTEDYVLCPCTETGNGIISDYSGKGFVLTEDSLKLKVDFNSKNSCCITPMYYLSCNENKLFGNSILNSEISAYYYFDFNIDCIYYFDTYIYVCGFVGNDYQVSRIKEDELNIIEPETTPEETTDTKPIKDETTPTGSTEADKSSLEFSSSKYEIRENDSIICNVEAGTTITKFKKNFVCNGEIKILDKNNVTKTSGNIGTNMKAFFSKNQESKVFSISVMGDLTGEGNVNSLDTNNMFDFLLENSSFSPIQTVSGDLNFDGRITNKDLVLLERMIAKGK